MTFVSYSQNFEDVILWRALKTVTNGFYIDVGAAHPDIESVTRAFYDRGWSGINLEPVPAAHARLAAARLRDINLPYAVGRGSGDATLHVVAGTGLSTTRDDMVADLRRSGHEVTPLTVPAVTLAAVCREHVTGREGGSTIHFLKIDVEGAEEAVIGGADFQHFRPWIVVVEATVPGSTTQAHANWEPALLSAEYRFVHFDGLNRFYLAAEKADELAPHFATPPNVFDEFIRAADTEWARRIAEADQRARHGEALAADVFGQLERTLAGVEASTVVHRREREQLRSAVAAAERRNAALEQRRAAEELRHALELRDVDERRYAQLLDVDAHAQRTIAQLQAMQRSASWRVTSPLRALLKGVRRPPASLPEAPGIEPLPQLAPPPLVSGDSEPGRPARRRDIRVVHQFHSGSAVGDAITNSMRLTRKLLRQCGYESEIFVEHIDPALGDDIRSFEMLPEHDDYVLIVRHSMGYEAFERIAALPAPKVLIYHNITPPDLLRSTPMISQYAELGRRQLAQLRPLVTAALADSDYTCIELERLGFDGVATCTLLFDPAELRAKAARQVCRRRTDAFTVLFVGRVAESKGQDDLIAAFAAFSRAFAGPSRLVIVGRHNGAGDPYYETLRDNIAANHLVNQVTLTGLVDGDELHAWYCAADLYVSLSRHEGFGVPLVEAFAYGVPVLAAPSGAVPYILGGAAGLLHDASPRAVSRQMLALAENPELRADQVRRQSAVLDEFALDRHMPVLLGALAASGAPAPPTAAHRARLAANVRFTITGHSVGSYSLAEVNRVLVLALDQAQPGSARLVPTEDQAALDDADTVCSRMTALIERGPHHTGPELVISQHYPVRVPDQRGDVLAALFFWEESAVPAPTIALLNREFRGVLAPSAFVAKALVDSGLSIPVHRVGYAPELSSFSRLRQERNQRAAGPVFTFLHVSSGFPRKGVDALLAAYARAFSAGDPVRLVIKSFPNPHNDLASQIAALADTHPGGAEIVLVDRDLPPDELLALYREADAMVLPTRGEGFNLPAAEAMAAGVPLIVTGYGGQMDFCSAETARLVAYRFAASGSHLATAHSVWVDPDVEDLASAMRDAFADRQASGDGETAIRARRATRAADALADPAALLQRMTTAALDLLLDSTPTELRVGWISSWGVRCGIAEYSRHLAGSMLMADPAMQLSVFCDHRTESASKHARLAVRPVWDIGDSTVPQLAMAVARTDPHVVLIQHQPGLMSWGILGDVLRTPVLRERPVVVTLHNTRHLLEIGESERAETLQALSGATRVLVHTMADRNHLRRLGLVTNVTLLPHGAPDRVAKPGPRPLSPSDAAVIGCYGFILPDKGIGVLIEAVALLRRTWPAARLRLVTAEYGVPESAAEIAACRRAAEALGVPVDWHTDFLPHEESLALLGDCDMVVLPYQSSLESSSAALRTALSAGPPVMVTDLPLFEEAGEAAFKLAGRDAKSIAAGLEAVLPDRALRHRSRERTEAWLSARGWGGVGERLAGMLRGLAVNWRRLAD